MKKILFLLLAAIFLSAAGCQSADRGSAASLPSGNIQTEFPGMTVCIETVNSNDETTELNILWRNKTPYDVLYGESYAIERLEDGQWVSCEKADAIFIAIGYQLKAGEEVTKPYTVSDLFDVSLPGTYRFKTSCFVYAGTEEGTPCELTAEFTVAAAANTEPLFQKPPQGTLITPEGRYPLILGGYSWTYETADGKAINTIADQTSRPLPASSLAPVSISQEHAGSVYAYYPKIGGYALADHQGFLVQLYFESAPTSITYQCWSSFVWRNPDIQPDDVDYFREEAAFYAKPGAYIYEITATWENTGRGYHGTANYYVYIVAGDDHIHQIPAQAQTVEDPVTGYCGNTQTTLYIGDQTYTFQFENSVVLTDILVNLDYNSDKVCRCRPEYTVDTEFGTGYGINLTQGYVRCEKGQADLTLEQLAAITEIIEWAEATNCQYNTEE